MTMPPLAPWMKRVRFLTRSVQDQIKKKCCKMWTTRLAKSKHTETQSGQRGRLQVGSKSLNLIHLHHLWTLLTLLLIPGHSRKMEKLNMIVQEGYPSHSSKTADLGRDQFGKTTKTLKWYDMFSEKKDFSGSQVHSRTKIDVLDLTIVSPGSHTYLLLASALSSRPVLQDTLRRWELLVTRVTCVTRLLNLAGSLLKSRTQWLHI